MNPNTNQPSRHFDSTVSPARPIGQQSVSTPPYPPHLRDHPEAWSDWPLPARDRAEWEWALKQWARWRGVRFSRWALAAGLSRWIFANATFLNEEKLARLQLALEQVARRRVPIIPPKP